MPFGSMLYGQFYDYRLFLFNNVHYFRYTHSRSHFIKIRITALHAFFFTVIDMFATQTLLFCLIPKKSDRFVFLFNQISIFSSIDIERKTIKLFIISIELFVVHIDVCHRWPFNLLWFVPVWFVTNRKATQSNIEH